MSTSDITLDKKNGIVTKTIRSKFYGYGLVAREAYWLRRLRAESDRFPEVLRFKGNVIQTVYMGDRIEGGIVANVPSDWIKQMSEVLEVMFSVGVRHNDIKPHDILVQDGRLHLIDFGWALPLCEKVPTSWPEGLGGVFKSPDGTPNDRFSFIQSVAYVLRYGKYEKRNIKLLPQSDKWESAC